MPIGTAISLLGGWPLIYPRKEVKTYGTKAEIEGAFSPGERVVIIDDLTTTGGSKFEAIERLGSAGLRVSEVVVLIDRQSGAAESLAQVGLRLIAVFSLTRMLDYWEAKGSVPASQIAAVRELGWNRLEMRGVQVPGFDKANFHDVPDAAFDRAAEELQAAGAPSPRPHGKPRNGWCHARNVGRQPRRQTGRPLFLGSWSS